MSEFATALKSLFDDTDYFRREEWAQFLCVPLSRLETWLKDEDIPRPMNLSMIVTCLQESVVATQEPLKNFLEMASKRATEASPHGSRMLPTVKEYYSRLISSDESSVLAKMSPDQQVKHLEEKYPA
jgi:hypothetical protein